MAINRPSLALLPALLALSCTRINPDYCDPQTRCSRGRVCDTHTRTCVSADAAAEVDAPEVEAAPDTRPGLEAGDAPGSCASEDDCVHSAAGPTCFHGLCKRCQGANECKSNLFCAIDAGRCVECTETDGCLDTPASPICLQNKCSPCPNDDACAGKYPTLPACDKAGGACVECTADNHCHSPTKPICDVQAKKCVACTADSQCATRAGPDNAGICLFHQDGRCATEAEVIHVQNAPGCSMTSGMGGTAAMPFCLTQDGINAVTPTKRVVILRGPDALTPWSATFTGSAVSVIGQASAIIAPGAFVGIRLGGGELYLRGVTVAGSTQAGIIVENGATLRMDRCLVTGNRGGLLVLSSGFDIANTVIAANKGALVPGTTTSYGGVYLKSAFNKPTVFRNDTVVDNEVIGLLCAEPYPVKSLLLSNNAVDQVVGCTATTSIVGMPPRFDALRPYHLTAASPCVNMGDENDFPPDDLDGESRPQMGRSDCGADEFKPPP